MTRTFADSAAARDAEWIVLATIEGCGTNAGTLYRFCSEVPSYGDSSYRPWLMEWPRAAPERVDPLGGLPTAGELTLSILDVDDTLTSEWRTEADPVAYLTAEAAAGDASITVSSVSGIAADAVLYIGNEALTVSGIAGLTVTTGRGKLDTDATKHPSGAPVYAYLPYLHSRRVRLYVVNKDAASSAQEHEIGHWRIDYRGLTEDLNGYTLRAQSQLKWLGRLAGMRPRESYELLSWRTSDWQGRPIGQLPASYAATLFTGQRKLFKNLDTKEVFSSAGYQNLVGRRGLYDSPMVEPTAGSTVVRVYGADPDDDPDAPTSYFRWSPPSPSSSRTSGTWTRSAHWVDIILNLATSSADPDDGLELANRNTTYGAWDCLPVGLGIGVPHVQIDWAAALDVRARTPDYLFPNFLIGEASIPFGQLVGDHFLRPIGAYFSTVGGVATIILPRLPLEGASALAIGSAEILARPVGRALYAHAIGAEQNVADARGALSYMVGPRRDRIELHASDFGAVFGQRGYYGHDEQAAEIEAPSARATSGGRCAFLEARAMGRLLRLWRPPWKLAPSVGSEQYAAGVGTQVAITHEQIPNARTGARGVTSLPAELSQVGWEVSPEEGYVHRWEAQSYGVLRVGRIAPSARIVSWDGSAATISSNRYTQTDASTSLPRRDSDSFTAGDHLELRDRSGVNLAPGVIERISSISTDKLTLSGDFGGVLTVGTGNAGQILRYATSADAKTELDSYVFAADVATRTVGATTQTPWRYGEP